MGSSISITKIHVAMNMPKKSEYDQEPVSLEGGSRIRSEQRTHLPHGAAH